MLGGAGALIAFVARRLGPGASPDERPRPGNDSTHDRVPRPPGSSKWKSQKLPRARSSAEEIDDHQIDRGLEGTQDERDGSPTSEAFWTDLGLPRARGSTPIL